MPYFTLIKQPAWFIMAFQAYLEGKSKAEDARMKKNKIPQTPQQVVNKYKFTGLKR